MQGVQHVQSQTAVKKTLMSIPHAQLSEHQVAALCMLGSLQHISSSSVDNILAATDLDEWQYAALLLPMLLFGCSFSQKSDVQLQRGLQGPQSGGLFPEALHVLRQFLESDHQKEQRTIVEQSATNVF